MVMTGAVLGGRYELAEQVGVGGYSEVWRATDTALSRPVAVKLLHPGYVRQGRALARFRDEARHAGALSHQNIARIYDYGEQPDGQSPYLVMELVEGPSLADVLAGGALGTPRSMDIVAQAAAGLQAAHAEGLVHRDVKPANMLLAPGGTVKITDFGIAHAIGAVPVTATGELLGTPGYLAPERVTGQQATEASDLYALGIVAYECLAGEPPFAGTALVIALAHRDRPLPPLPQSVPADVCALVMQLTAKDPAWRPGSAAEVALRAGRLRDGQGDRDARSGFLYYVSTALSSLIIPLPAITMAWFFPQWVRPWNTIWLAGALALWLVVYPLVMRGRWRIEVLRVQTVYGFAHAFNIVHLLRNRVAEWHPTSSKAPAPIAVKVKRFYTVYLGLALSAVAVGLIMRTAEDGLTLFAGMLVFFVLNLYVVGPLVVSGIGDEPRSRRQRPVSPKPRPEDFADSSCLIQEPCVLLPCPAPPSCLRGRRHGHHDAPGDPGDPGRDPGHGREASAPPPAGQGSAAPVPGVRQRRGVRIRGRHRPAMGAAQAARSGLLLHLADDLLRRAELCAEPLADLARQGRFSHLLAGQVERPEARADSAEHRLL
jgi:hypothetical protein